VSETSKPSGPDLNEGIEDSAVAEGVPLLGHVGDEAVMIVRTKGELFAVGATCSHYGGPLSEGLIVGDAVHCPWHHARFCLRTGAVEAAPALNPVACYRVEKLGTRLARRRRGAPSKGLRGRAHPGRA
jgi:nitrite reductase/ring-hydroxylating ferredoxin subunit